MVDSSVQLVSEELVEVVDSSVQLVSEDVETPAAVENVVGG